MSDEQWDQDFDISNSKQKSYDAIGTLDDGILGLLDDDGESDLDLDFNVATDKSVVAHRAIVGLEANKQKTEIWDEDEELGLRENVEPLTPVNPIVSSAFRPKSEPLASKDDDGDEDWDFEMLGQSIDRVQLSTAFQDAIVFGDDPEPYNKVIPVQYRYPLVTNVTNQRVIKYPKSPLLKTMKTPSNARYIPEHLMQKWMKNLTKEHYRGEWGVFDSKLSLSCAKIHFREFVKSFADVTAASGILNNFLASFRHVENISKSDVLEICSVAVAMIALQCERLPFLDGVDQDALVGISKMANDCRWFRLALELVNVSSILHNARKSSSGEDCAATLEELWNAVNEDGTLDNSQTNSLRFQILSIAECLTLNISPISGGDVCCAQEDYNFVQGKLDDDQSIWNPDCRLEDMQSLYLDTHNPMIKLKGALVLGICHLKSLQKNDDAEQYIFESVFIANCLSEDGVALLKTTQLGYVILSTYAIILRTNAKFMYELYALEAALQNLKQRRHASQLSQTSELAVLCLASNKTKKALSYFNEAISISRINKKTNELIHLTMSLGDALLDIGHLDMFERLTRDTLEYLNGPIPTSNDDSGIFSFNDQSASALISRRTKLANYTAESLMACGRYESALLLLEQNFLRFYMGGHGIRRCIINLAKAYLHFEWHLEAIQILMVFKHFSNDEHLRNVMEVNWIEVDMFAERVITRIKEIADPAVLYHHELSEKAELNSLICEIFVSCGAGLEMGNFVAITDLVESFENNPVFMQRSQIYRRMKSHYPDFISIVDQNAIPRNLSFSLLSKLPSRKSTTSKSFSSVHLHSALSDDDYLMLSLGCIVKAQKSCQGVENQGGKLQQKALFCQIAIHQLLSGLKFGDGAMSFTDKPGSSFSHEQLRLDASEILAFGVKNCRLNLMLEGSILMTEILSIKGDFSAAELYIEQTRQITASITTDSSTSELKSRIAHRLLGCLLLSKNFMALNRHSWILDDTLLNLSPRLSAPSRQQRDKIFRRGSKSVRLLDENNEGGLLEILPFPKTNVESEQNEDETSDVDEDNDSVETYIPSQWQLNSRGLGTIDRKCAAFNAHFLRLLHSSESRPTAPGLQNLKNLQAHEQRLCDSVKSEISSGNVLTRTLFIIQDGDHVGFIAPAVKLVCWERVNFQSLVRNAATSSSIKKSNSLSKINKISNNRPAQTPFRIRLCLSVKQDAFALLQVPLTCTLEDCMNAVGLNTLQPNFSSSASVNDASAPSSDSESLSSSSTTHMVESPQVVTLERASAIGVHVVEISKAATVFVEAYNNEMYRARDEFSYLVKKAAEKPSVIGRLSILETNEKVPIQESYLGYLLICQKKDSIFDLYFLKRNLIPQNMRSSESATLNLVRKTEEISFVKSMVADSRVDSNVQIMFHSHLMNDWKLQFSRVHAAITHMESRDSETDPIIIACSPALEIIPWESIFQLKTAPRSFIPRSASINAVYFKDIKPATSTRPIFKILCTYFDDNSTAKKADAQRRRAFAANVSFKLFNERIRGACMGHDMTKDILLQCPLVRKSKNISSYRRRYTSIKFLKLGQSTANQLEEYSAAIAAISRTEYPVLLISTADMEMMRSWIGTIKLGTSISIIAAPAIHFKTVAIKLDEAMSKKSNADSATRETTTTTTTDAQSQLDPTTMTKEEELQARIQIRRLVGDMRTSDGGLEWPLILVELSPPH